MISIHRYIFHFVVVPHDHILIKQVLASRKTPAQYPSTRASSTPSSPQLHPLGRSSKLISDNPLRDMCLL
jgi:hypothetical protein